MKLYTYKYNCKTKKLRFIKQEPVKYISYSVFNGVHLISTIRSVRKYMEYSMYSKFSFTYKLSQSQKNKLQSYLDGKFERACDLAFSRI